MRTIRGLANFRDLGGLPAGEDQAISSDALYRSSDLAHLDRSGIADLEDSPLGLILDLRTDGEAAVAPDPRVVGADTIRVPLQGGDMRAAITAMLAHDQGHIDAIALLHNLYLTILTSETVNVVKAVHTVAAAPEHKSVLVHCTAGKDRTGIIVALLLDVCDVPRAQIVADYTLSHSYLSGPWEHGMRAAIEQAGIQIPQQFLPLLTASPASLIEGALDYVHDQYGDAAHYLTGKGLASADIDALRSRFISSAAHAYGHDDGFDGAHSQEGL